MSYYLNGNEPVYESSTNNCDSNDQQTSNVVENVQRANNTRSFTTEGSLDLGWRPNQRSNRYYISYNSYRQNNSNNQQTSNVVENVQRANIRWCFRTEGSSHFNFH